jgi:hypothetical protein
MYSFYSENKVQAQTPNLESDEEWRRMKEQLDLEYQHKLKQVNDEAMAKLNAHRMEHKMKTHRLEQSYI